MADEAEGGNNGDEAPKLDLGALVAAASGVVVAVGGLAATGTLGRVQRDHPWLFLAALALVLLGAAAWTIASLPAIPWRAGDRRRWSWRPREWRPLTWQPWRLKTAAVALTVVGVCIALGASIETANDEQRPTVAGEVDQRTNEFKATVRAANLASDEKLVVWVDGLVPSAKEKGRVFDFTTLAHSYVGPSPDGEVDLPIRARVEAGRFQAVGVRAFTTDNPGECANYRRQVQAEAKALTSREVGTGCIVLPLARRLAAPTVQATWQGTGRDAASLRIKISAANTASRAALTIVGRERRRTDTLYRARLEPDDAGAIARTIRLPISDRTRHVCVQAAFRKPRENDPRAIRCPFSKGQRLLGRLELSVPWTTPSSSAESYNSGAG